MTHGRRKEDLGRRKRYERRPSLVTARVSRFFHLVMRPYLTSLSFIFVGLVCKPSNHKTKKEDTNQLTVKDVDKGRNHQNGNVIKMERKMYYLAPVSLWCHPDSVRHKKNTDREKPRCGILPSSTAVTTYPNTRVSHLSNSRVKEETIERMASSPSVDKCNP